MRTQYTQQKENQFVELWKCELLILHKTDASVKKHLREFFPYEDPLSEERHMQESFGGLLFGYVEYGIEVPQNLRKNFSNFPQFFKNTAVSRTVFGNLWEGCSEEEDKMAQP